MNDHTNGNGANGNGNGHEKIFGLTKAEDPMLSIVVPQARRRVCQNTKIPESARMFFCWLTDMSLLPGVNSRRGVVKFSNSYLAQRFDVSEKTIQNWKQWVCSTSEIWVTEKWMKNSFPQTVYNIAAIVGQATLPMNVDSDDGSLADDEIFSCNRRRQKATKRDKEGSGKFACRAHGVSGCPICRRETPPTPQTPEVSPEILRNQAENDTAGIILPATTAIDCRPQRQMVAVHNGNGLPSATAIDCRGERQLVAAGDGNGLPLSPATDCRGDRNQIAGNGKTENRESVLKEKRGEPTPPDNAFETWRRGLQGQFPSHLRVLEKKIRAKLETAGSEAVKAGLRRQLKAVCDVLLPPVPDDPKPGPTRAVKPAAPPLPKMNLAEARARMAKAKAEAGL